MASRTEPPWLRQARASIGLHEIPGAPTEPTIAAWLRKLGAWWTDDETPWCGTACAAWMRAGGIPPPKAWYRAKGWLEFGRPLSAAVPGCVVVFDREGGGHVGLVVAVDPANNLLVIGGNQGDSVSIRAFQRSRVLGYRWPMGYPQPEGYMPVVAGPVAASISEA